MYFISVLRYMLAFFPVPVQALIFGILGILAIVAVLKIIALVLDAIPFL